MTTANYATLFLVCKLGHTCARRGPCIWDPTGRRSVWVGWCIWSVSLQVLTRLWSHGSWHFMAFPMWSTSSTRQKTHQLPVFSSGFFRELSAPSKCYLGTKLDTIFAATVNKNVLETILPLNFCSHSSIPVPLPEVARCKNSSVLVSLWMYHPIRDYLGDRVHAGWFINCRFWIILKNWGSNHRSLSG